MSDLQDYVLEKEPDSPPPIHRPSRVPWLLAVVLITTAAGGYWYLGRQPVAPAAAPSAATTPSAPPSRAPLGITTPPVDLPPLDQSDAFVRDLVRGLSSRPALAAWLMTNGLIRNAVLVVDNIAGGMTPARQLRVLAPRERFRVLDSHGQAVVDPASYGRYDAIGEAVSSIEATGVARAYSTLKPRVEEAYRDLGHDGPFDIALETAIVSLLQTPVVDGEPAVLPQGALYRFSDARLERLTPAQKQLVRMGPRNVRAIQRKLREIAVALGIPAERLPAH